MVFGSQTYCPPAAFAYLWPGDGLITGMPFGLVGTHAGSALVANGLVADGRPSSPIVFTPGTKPMSNGFDGPRLLAPEDEPSYPAPAADGRGWKYRGSGLPWPSVNS